MKTRTPLLPMQCSCQDDNDVQCQNIMTKQEFQQDGYCSRCAELLWDWMEKTKKEIDATVIFK